MAIKSFSGVKEFYIKPVSGLADPIVLATKQYRQFPPSVPDAGWSLEVSGSLSYNLTTNERTSQVSQMGDTVGVVTEKVPAFIEGEFYDHLTEGVSLADGTRIQDYLENQIAVNIQTKNRAGEPIIVENAHVTEVSDTDAIAGTFTCRWEGTAQVNASM